jgi:nicotinamide-nucleotide amidase
MKAVIISVGTELTLGHVLDTNSAWLAGRLTELGITISAHITLPDDEGAAVEALESAARSAGLVLVTGGLGPTDDDVTRQVLARVMGVELVEDAECWARIQAYFSQRSYRMTPSNRRQALVPAGARPIGNTCGTAPGLSSQVHRAKVYCQTGVPSEMEAMFRRDVEPELRARSGGRAIVSRTLLTFGKGESAVGEMLADLMVPGRNPALGTLAENAVIGVRVLARGNSPAKARELLEADVAEIRARLGDLVFGEGSDTLAGAVGRLLAERGGTLSVAESCTGGLLAKLVTDIPGSSAYFLGGMVTYANRAKVEMLDVPAGLIDRYGAVSAETAEAMADGCRRRSGSDYALSTTGVAGPTGGTPQKPVGLVYIGLADAGGTEVRELKWGQARTRDEVRVRTCWSALNLLRKRLLRNR